MCELSYFFLQGYAFSYPIIRFVPKWIEENPNRSPVGMLRLKLDASCKIWDYQFRVGALKEFSKELGYEGELKAVVIRKQMQVVVSHIMAVNPKLAEELKYALKNLPELEIIE